MPTLRDRLLTVEDDFQKALADGRDAVSAFNTRWERLLTDVDSAWDADILDEGTASLAHTTALRISLLAETSMLIYSSCDTLTSQLVDEVEMLMAELSISNACVSVSHADSSCKPFLEFSQDDLDTHLRPRKRRRDSNASTTPMETHKRRRPSTLDEGSSLSTRPLVHDARALIPSTSSDVHAPTSRKRRLSDADMTVPRQAKRPYTGPRLHAVSDSFPELHASNPEVLCTRRLLRSPPPIVLEVSATGLPAVEASDFDITQAGSESNASIPIRSPLAASLNLDALDGFLSSVLEPSEALLALPPSLNPPYAIFDMPLSPLSSSRSSSVSLDSSSSIASLSPPPSYPSTPPPATCSSSDLPPYQFSATWDDIAPSPVSSATSSLPSIQGDETIFPTHKPAPSMSDSFGHDSFGHDSVWPDWSTLFQSMNYYSWTPYIPLSDPSSHFSKPSVHDIVPDLSSISFEQEKLSIVA